MAQGTLHTYLPSRSLVLFEHSPPNFSTTTNTSPTLQQPPKNTLLFIGGMFSSFLSPSYTLTLPALLSPHWRVCEVQLSSAGRGFGTSSLAKDVQELEAAVRFVRQTLHGTTTAGEDEDKDEGKVVLMGHSTGCQDALSYLSLPTKSSPLPLSARPKIDGVILQAPVSDREAAHPHLVPATHEEQPTEQKVRDWDALLKAAGETAEGKRRETLLDMGKTSQFFGPVAMSVERFLSLASPGSPGSPREDDLFSSDASEAWLERTWGMVGRGPVLRGFGDDRKEILVLVSDQDEYCPGWVDKERLVGKWKDAAEREGGRLAEGSGLLEGAVHDLGGENAERVVKEMGRRVSAYLRKVLGEAATKMVDGEARGGAKI
jgi:pimeloyl-ACP methyl ester carboxylesterase